MKQYSISRSSSRFRIFRFITLLLLMLGMVILTPNAYSAQVVLTWEKLPDPVTGYNIYYGPNSGTYTQNIDVGDVGTYTIENLACGTTYYIVATDHDAGGTELDRSNEVIATIPACQQYALAVSKTGTGTGTVNGAGIDCGTVCGGSYAPGTDVVLTATANYGSVFSGWSGGGGTGSYETVMNAAASVTATFTRVYSITATSNINGSIIPSGNPPVSQASNGSTVIKIVTVSQGTDQSFTITPSTGYHLADLKADGTSVGAVSTYTFSNVAADHTLNATFAINNYSITASAGTGGGISPSGATTVGCGGNQTYTITPTAGYSIAGVTVDGVSARVISTYTFTNITANHTISASFAATSTSYTLSAVSSRGGSISPRGSKTVNSGGSQTYTFSPNNGYHIADVKIDGVSVGAVSTYTFTNITANHTISATFTNKTYTITASSGANGSISPAGSTNVNYGGSQSYSITPATGYSIADVKVDGMSVGSVSTYNFSNVTTSHTIAATFAVNTWINQSIASQTGAFTASFDLIPNANNIDSVTGFSAVPAASFTDQAVTVRFNASGAIDVRNGSSYAANVVMPYSAGNVYHIRMQIDVPNHRYDVYVTPQGGTVTQLASGYSFRTAQAGVTVLNNFSIYCDLGSHQVLNLLVTGNL